MPDEIQAGDTVRLKSSGPLMTVESILNGQLKCTWFDDKLKIQHGTFSVAMVAKESPNSGLI